MSYANLKNPYQTLNLVEDSGEPSHKQLERKALKKLREIENLKKKPNPTVEEQEKIKTEKYLKNFIEPQEYKPTAKEVKKRLEKEKKRKREQEKKEQEQRRIKAEEQRRIKAEQDKKDQEKFNQKREQDRIKLEKEKARILLEEQIKRDIVLGSLHMKTPQAITIYNEYMEILNSENSKIAFRKLCLKYHPDKNPTKNTTHCQQILQHIHEKNSRI